MTHLRLAVLDLADGSATRVPGRETGIMELGIVIDELSGRLVLDPVDLRVRDDT